MGMGEKPYMKIELFGEAVEAIKEITTITARRPDELISDALRTYLWILHQQTFGRKVVSKNGGLEGEKEIVRLVENEEAARGYFKKLGW